MKEWCCQYRWSFSTWIWIGTLLNRFRLLYFVIHLVVKLYVLNFTMIYQSKVKIKYHLYLRSSSCRSYSNVFHHKSQNFSCFLVSKAIFRYLCYTSTYSLLRCKDSQLQRFIVRKKQIDFEILTYEKYWFFNFHFIFHLLNREMI